MSSLVAVLSRKFHYSLWVVPTPKLTAGKWEIIFPITFVYPEEEPKPKKKKSVHDLFS